MRKLLLGVTAMPLVVLGLGCHHVGGECDCAAVPGDSVNHNPHVTYHAGNPATSTPAHTGTITTAPAAPAVSNFEPIAPPKNMPPK